MTEGGWRIFAVDVELRYRRSLAPGFSDEIVIDALDSQDWIGHAMQPAEATFRVAAKKGHSAKLHPARSVEVETTMLGRERSMPEG